MRHKKTNEIQKRKLVSLKSTQCLLAPFIFRRFIWRVFFRLKLSVWISFVSGLPWIQISCVHFLNRTEKKRKRNKKVWTFLLAIERYRKHFKIMAAKNWLKCSEKKKYIFCIFLGQNVLFLTLIENDRKKLKV